MAFLRDVNKPLKMDPGNADLLAQKQKYLTDAIDATKKKLQEEKFALEQLKAGPQTDDTIRLQEDLTREIVDTEQKLKGLTKEYQNFGSVAVKTAADFDSGMSKVFAVSSATGSDLEALRDKAREMGEKTKFSASGAAMEGYKSIWSAGFGAINQLTGGKLGDAFSTAKSKMEEIKTAFSDAMGNAKSGVSGALDKIKGFFANCHLKLPHINLPHFSLEGTFSLDPPSVSHISVSWYRKAMDDA